MHIPKKILVAVDFSDHSNAALDYAIALADRIGASVEVLHVWDPPAFVGPEVLLLGGNELRMSITDYTRRIAGQEMEDLLAGPLRRGIRGLEGHVERGNPADVICRFAGEHGFDLVVVGTHGRSGFSRFMAGSVAEKVMRNCPCPVLTVREPRLEAERRREAATEVRP